MSSLEQALAATGDDLGLDVVDALAPGAPREYLRELQEQHLHFFPDHAHVLDEYELCWRQEWPEPGVHPHGWVFRAPDGRPVGLAVFHVNTRRGIDVQHFLGLDPDVRADMPFRWVGMLMDRLREVGEADCEAAGTTLLGQVAEHYPAHAAAWARFGYQALDVDYHEPHHGRAWPRYGDLEFFPMTAQVRPADAGRQLPRADLAVEAVSAFLLDHYRLPADHPTVVKTLALASALPD